jgi:thymidylate synthase (FAD)
MSFARPRPGGNKAYLEHIKEVGHGSVLEHSTFNLIITGVSRSFTHELVRHRVGFSYSQLSQRFVDESDCELVCPPIIAEDPELAEIWGDAVDHMQSAYTRIAQKLSGKLDRIEDKTLRRKRAREAARSVLPNATETKIFVTGNARSLRHFIEIRSDEAADMEIREVAIKVLEALKPLAPNLFGDYEIVETPDGGRSAATKYRKV